MLSKGVRNVLSAILPFLTAAVLPGNSLAAEPADLVLFDGKVLTVDNAFSIKSALVIKKGRLVAVGGPELLKHYNAATKIDLHGRVVLPGFMDTHLHVFGEPHRQVDLAHAKSIAEIQALIRAKAAALGPGEWVTGVDWDEYQLAEKRRPLRGDLDAAAANNPVLVTRAGGHSAVGNSLALQLGGITRATPDPTGGLIERDEQGEPNGVIRERNDLIAKLVPPDTPEQLRTSYISKLEVLPSLGITSMIVAGANLEMPHGESNNLASALPSYPEFESLYAQYGERFPRASVQIMYPGAEQLSRYPHKSGYGNDRLRLGAIGEGPVVDGGFTGPTACTSQDYKGLPGFRGRCMFTPEQLQTMADSVAAAGWQLGLHMIGDAAINMGVRAYAQAIEKYHLQDPRWFTSHFTMLPSQETLQLMVKYGVMAAAQPNFLYTLEGRYVQTLDGDRLQHINPVATPAKDGILVAFGSDDLPIDPRIGLYAAVTRKGSSGTVYGPEEAVSIREAIRMYTANPPYLTREEHEKGTLEAGKLADVIVLDQDPLAIAPERLLHLNVDLTIIGGRIVYRRPNGGD
jgi:predicted amidohydrolase YtcJ